MLSSFWRCISSQRMRANMTRPARMPALITAAMKMRTTTADVRRLFKFDTCIRGASSVTREGARITAEVGRPLTHTRHLQKRHSSMPAM